MLSGLAAQASLETNYGQEDNSGTHFAALSSRFGGVTATLSDGGLSDNTLNACCCVENWVVPLRRAEV